MVEKQEQTPLDFQFVTFQECETEVDSQNTPAETAPRAEAGQAPSAGAVSGSREPNSNASACSTRSLDSQLSLKEG